MDTILLTIVNRSSLTFFFLFTLLFFYLLPPLAVVDIGIFWGIWHVNIRELQMTMDQQLTIGEPGISWSPTTTPGSDIIEEVSQRPEIVSLGSPGYRHMRAPIRRRLRIEERRSGSGKKMYETFEISVVDSRASVDGSDASLSSAVTVITSATSSCTDPWSSSGGFVEEEETDDDINWDQEDQDEEGFVVPKLEPIEDVNMADVEQADVKGNIVPETPSAGSTPAQTKRPRGRPRKHPKPTPESMAKVTKGRSKTGCITCRRRKKKCDEAKPGCESIQTPAYSD